MDLKILRDTPPWEWPKDAGSRLRRTLRDGQAKPSDLLLAAELAGDLVVADDDLIQALLAIVGDGGAWPDLRAQAAISLGPVLEFTDTEGFDADAEAPISEKTLHEIQDTLRDLFADAAVPRLVRRRILEAAVRAPQDWQKGAVGAAYRSDDAEWRLTAVFCMATCAGSTRRSWSRSPARTRTSRPKPCMRPVPGSCPQRGRTSRRCSTHAPRNRCSWRPSPRRSSSDPTRRGCS